MNMIRTSEREAFLVGDAAEGTVLGSEIEGRVLQAPVGGNRISGDSQGGENAVREP